MSATHPDRPMPSLPATTDNRNWFQQRLDNDEIDLLALFKTVWRRRWAIGSLALVVMALAALITSNMTPIYSASVTLLIEPPAQRVVSIEQIYSPEGAGGRDFMGTQVELLQSRGLRERVVRELSLHTHYEFDPGQQEPPLIDVRGWLRSIQGSLAEFEITRLIPGVTPEDIVDDDDTVVALSEDQLIERTVRALGGRLDVEPVRNSQLVIIRVEMADRFMAAEIANAISRGYIERQMEAAVDQSLSAVNWMSGRMDELRVNLRDAEQRLQAYRDEFDLVDVSGILTVSANELSSLSERLINARQRRAEAESRYRQIDTMRDQGWERISSVPAVMSNELVREFKSDEARTRARIEELGTRYGPRHPTMVAAQSDLVAARTNLRTQVEQVVASIETEFQLAVANERALRDALDQNRDEVQELSRRDFEFQELQREVSSNRALYDTFLTRMQETSATVDLDPINARVIDSAEVPNSPVRPRSELIIVLSGMLAGMGGMGLALLVVALDSTFRGSEEVEETLNLPVLGIVPDVGKHTERHELSHKFLDNDAKTFAEALRTIRTGVLLSGADRPLKRLLVTSTIPGEGKSTVTTNLAFALQQMENTVLIDADMRRPTLAKAFNLPPGTPGLANVILGHARLSDAVIEVDGLNLLPAGVVPPNPLELLSSESFRSILDTLTQRYDRVLIDSPPVQAVSDALLLGTKVDAVVYVINAHRTQRVHAMKAVGQMLQAGAPLFGTVLNQVNVQKSQRYGYTYGGYYDYYGYSETTEATSKNPLKRLFGGKKRGRSRLSGSEPFAASNRRSSDVEHKL